MVDREEEIAQLERMLRQERRQNETIERQLRFRMAAMNKIQAELRDNVAELRLALGQAEVAARAKDTFLATISHELRTPLHGIHAASSLLEREAFSPQQQELTTLISQSTASLQDSIEGLLDFARIEAGILDLHPEPLSPRGLIDAVVAGHAEAAEANGNHVTIDIDDELPLAGC